MCSTFGPQFRSVVWVLLPTSRLIRIYRACARVCYRHAAVARATEVTKKVKQNMLCHLSAGPAAKKWNRICINNDSESFSTTTIDKPNEMLTFRMAKKSIANRNHNPYFFVLCLLLSQIYQRSAVVLPAARNAKRKEIPLASTSHPLLWRTSTDVGSVSLTKMFDKAQAPYDIP